jgi:hypothetical protein
MHRKIEPFGPLVSLFLLAGCTCTTLRLTGTPGAAFRGGEAYGEGKPADWTNTIPWVEKWWAPYYGWPVIQVSHCEFRKVDTNSVLRLELREHRGRVGVLAPAGTSGVRLTWNGKGYDSEVLK